MGPRPSVSTQTPNQSIHTLPAAGARPGWLSTTRRVRWPLGRPRERLRRLCAPTLSEVPAERLCCLRRWAGCSSGLAVGASARSPVRGAGWRGQGHSPGCAPGGAHALCSVRRAATHGHTLWLGAHGTVRARALCSDAGQLGVGVRAWAASTALANARMCVVVCEAPACVPRVVEPWLAARRLQRAATILAPSGKVASRRRT